MVKKIRVLPLVAAAALLASALPAGAQGFGIGGTARCDGGGYTITWELENLFTTASGDITEAELSGEGSGSVTFDPDPLPADGTSTGTSTHPGTTSGTVTLDVTVDYGQGGILSDSASVELEGDCLAPTTTTTTTQPTTTTAPAPVVAEPTFTG